MAVRVCDEGYKNHTGPGQAKENALVAVMCMAERNKRSQRVCESKEPQKGNVSRGMAEDVWEKTAHGLVEACAQQLVIEGLARETAVGTRDIGDAVSRSKAIAKGSAHLVVDRAVLAIVGTL